MNRILLLLTVIKCLSFISCHAQEQQPNFWIGRTAGELPYMNYGLGSDRLGGAKIGYLDSNIMVKVIDSVRDTYKVQLSREHVAYIPKANIRHDINTIPVASYYTRNWHVSGDSLYDYAKISLEEKLPYRSVQDISPSRIMVDIYGVINNTNWITQLTNAKEIKNAWYEQVEDDVFRVILELRHTQHWGYDIYYDTLGTTLVIKVKRQPELALSKLKIAVDAGHGGGNKGARGGRTKIEEKTYNLLIAKQVQKELQNAGAKHIFMTRTSDVNLSMPERLKMLYKYNPDVLISVHLNSAGKDSISGVSTYYRYIGFRPLSQFVLSRMLELGLNEYGNVGSFNFALNSPTQYPNALVEVAFLSNRSDERKILDPKFRNNAAKKIVMGIEDWLEAMKEEESLNDE